MAHAHKRDQVGSRVRTAHNFSADVGKMWARGWNSIIVGEGWSDAAASNPYGSNYEIGRLNAVAVRALGVTPEPWGGRKFTSWPDSVGRSFAAARKVGLVSPVPFSALR